MEGLGLVYVLFIGAGFAWLIIPDKDDPYYPKAVTHKWGLHGVIPMLLFD